MIEHAYGNPEESKPLVEECYGRLLRAEPIYDDGEVTVSTLVGTKSSGLHMVYKASKLDMFLPRATILRLLLVLMGGT